MPAHHPVPWILKDWNKGRSSAVFRPMDIHDALDKRVFRITERAYDLPVAEFVIKAVNNHDKLVEALEGILANASFDQGPDGSYPYDIDTKTAIDKAKAALEAAAR